MKVEEAEENLWDDAEVDNGTDNILTIQGLQLLVKYDILASKPHQHRLQNYSRGLDEMFSGILPQ